VPAMRPSHRGCPLLCHSGVSGSTSSWVSAAISPVALWNAATEKVSEPNPAGLTVDALADLARVPPLPFRPLLVSPAVSQGRVQAGDPVQVRVQACVLPSA
jgi:hypothetical protein